MSHIITFSFPTRLFFHLFFLFPVASAEDADSLPEAGAIKKREGAFCVWTFEQVHSVVSCLTSPVEASVADIICHHFDIRPQGNVDPYQVCLRID